MSIQGVLLDVEGTTSSISFVYDEMFPFVRRELDGFLMREWNTDEVQDCLSLLANDMGVGALSDWFADADDTQQRQLVANAVFKLMDNDVKATGLKQLQGLIWKDGFHSGQLVSHLFDDVAPTLKCWNDGRLDVRIYSSGSIAAQKLFFGHTVAGNLLPLLHGHYDTTTGPKQVPASYAKIAEDFGLHAEKIVFISDVDAELDAASAAGMRTVLCLRTGNKPVADQARFSCIKNFEELSLFEWFA